MSAHVYVRILNTYGCDECVFVSCLCDDSVRVKTLDAMHFTLRTRQK